MITFLFDYNLYEIKTVMNQASFGQIVHCHRKANRIAFLFFYDITYKILFE